MSSTKTVVLTAEEFRILERPMALDMIAYFELLKERAQKILREAEKEGLSPNEIIARVEKLLQPE